MNRSYGALLKNHFFIRLRQLCTFLLILTITKIPWFYFTALPVRESISFGADRHDLLSRRAYLVDRVGGPDFSPSTMPFLMDQVFQEEWAIGTLSMTTSALTNLAFEFPETREESKKVVGQLINRMLAADIRVFEERYWGEDALETLNTSHGHIGYLGHLNLMLSAYRILGGDCQHSDLHRRVTEALVSRIQESPTRYLETFPGQIFIPDNMVVAASIAQFDIAEATDHSSTLKLWLDETQKTFLDPKTQVIFPTINRVGEPFGIPRGSYATWNSYFLPFVDEAAAGIQFAAVKQNFLVQPIDGFSAFREYPRGQSGPGDIDSGPIIFGLSTSGTGFGMAGIRRANDAKNYYGLLRTAELAGYTFEIDGKRRYLLAPLIGDAIVLAMRTSRPWDRQFVSPASCG